jgi:hypothetical protein
MSRKWKSKYEGTGAFSNINIDAIIININNAAKKLGIVCDKPFTPYDRLIKDKRVFRKEGLFISR